MFLLNIAEKNNPPPELGFRHILLSDLKAFRAYHREYNGCLIIICFWARYKYAHANTLFLAFTSSLGKSGESYNFLNIARKSDRPGIGFEDFASEISFA